MSHHYSGPDYGFPRGDATATMYRGLKFTFSTPVISPWTRLPIEIAAMIRGFVGSSRLGLPARQVG
jgi:hypothetical protein